MFPAATPQGPASSRSRASADISPFSSSGVSASDVSGGLNDSASMSLTPSPQAPPSQRQQRWRSAGKKDPLAAALEAAATGFRDSSFDSSGSALSSGGGAGSGDAFATEEDVAAMRRDIEAAEAALERENTAEAAAKLLNDYRNYASSLYSVLRTTQRHGEDMKTTELERAMEYEDQIDSLKNALDEARSRTEAAEAKVAALRRESTDAASAADAAAAREAAALRRDCDAHRQRIAEMEAEATAGRAALGQARASIHELRAQLSAAQEHADSRGQEAAAWAQERWEGRVQDLQAQLRRLKEELEEAQAAAAGVKRENGALQDQLASARRDIGAVRGDLAAANDARKAAASELSSVKAALARLQDEHALCRGLQDHSEAFTKLRQQYHSAQEEFDREVRKLRQQNNELEASSARLQVELREERAASLRKDGRLSEAERMLSGAEAEIATWRGRAEDVLAGLRATEADKSAAVQALTARAEAAEAAADALKASIEEMRATAAPQARVTELEGLLQQASEAASRGRTEIQRLRQANVDAQARVDSLTSRLRDIGAERDEAVAAAQRLQAQVSQLSAQAAQGSGDSRAVDGLRRELATLRDALAAAEARADAKEGDTAARKNGNEGTEEEKEDEIAGSVKRKRSSGAAHASDAAVKASPLYTGLLEEVKTLKRRALAAERADAEAAAREKALEAAERAAAAAENAKNAAEARAASAEAKVSHGAAQLRTIGADVLAERKARKAADAAAAAAKEEGRAARAAAEEARTASARLQQRIDELQAACDRHSSECASLRQQLDTERQGRTAAVAKLEASRQRISVLESKLEDSEAAAASLQQLQSLEAQLAAALEAQETARSAAATAKADAEAAVSAAEDRAATAKAAAAAAKEEAMEAASALSAARSRCDTYRSDAAALEDAAAGLQNQLRRANGRAEEAEAAAAAAQADATQCRAALEEARAEARAAQEAAASLHAKEAENAALQREVAALKAALTAAQGDARREADAAAHAQKALTLETQRAEERQRRYDADIAELEAALAEARGTANSEDNGEVERNSDGAQNASGAADAANNSVAKDSSESLHTALARLRKERDVLAAAAAEAQAGWDAALNDVNAAKAAAARAEQELTLNAIELREARRCWEADAAGRGHLRQRLKAALEDAAAHRRAADAAEAKAAAAAGALSDKEGALAWAYREIERLQGLMNETLSGWSGREEEGAGAAYARLEALLSRLCVAAGAAVPRACRVGTRDKGKEAAATKGAAKETEKEQVKAKEADKDSNKEGDKEKGAERCVDALRRPPKHWGSDSASAISSVRSAMDASSLLLSSFSAAGAEEAAAEFEKVVCDIEQRLAADAEGQRNAQELQQLLEEKDLLLKDLRRQLEDTATDNYALEESTSRLCDEKRRLQTQLREAQVAIDDARRSAEAAKADADAAAAALAKETEKCRAAEVAAAAAQREATVAAAEARDSRASLDALRGELDEKSAEVRRKDLRDVEERDTALQVLRRRAEELEAALVAAEKRCAAAATRHRHAADDSERHKAAAAALRADCDALKAQNATLSAVLQEASSDAAAAARDYAALEALAALALALVRRSRVLLGNEVWVGGRGGCVVGLAETAANMGLTLRQPHDHDGEHAEHHDGYEGDHGGLLPGAADERDGALDSSVLDLRVMKPVKVLRDLLRSAGYVPPQDADASHTEESNGANASEEGKEEETRDEHEGDHGDEHSMSDAGDDERYMGTPPAATAALHFSATSTPSSMYSSTDDDADSSAAATPQGKRTKAAVHSGGDVPVRRRSALLQTPRKAGSGARDGHGGDHDGHGAPPATAPAARTRTRLHDHHDASLHCRAVALSILMPPVLTSPDSALRRSGIRASAALLHSNVDVGRLMAAAVDAEENGDIGPKEEDKDTVQHEDTNSEAKNAPSTPGAGEGASVGGQGNVEGASAADGALAMTTPAKQRRGYRNFTFMSPSSTPSTAVSAMTLRLAEDGCADAESSSLFFELQAATPSKTATATPSKAAAATPGKSMASSAASALWDFVGSTDVASLHVSATVSAATRSPSQHDDGHDRSQHADDHHDHASPVKRVHSARAGGADPDGGDSEACHALALLTSLLSDGGNRRDSASEAQPQLHSSGATASSKKTRKSGSGADAVDAQWVTPQSLDVSGHDGKSLGASSAWSEAREEAKGIDAGEGSVLSHHDEAVHAAGIGSDHDGSDHDGSDSGSLGSAQHDHDHDDGDKHEYGGDVGDSFLTFGTDSGFEAEDGAVGSRSEQQPQRHFQGHSALNVSGVSSIDGSAYRSGHQLTLLSRQQPQQRQQQQQQQHRSSGHAHNRQPLSGYDGPDGVVLSAAALSSLRASLTTLTFEKRVLRDRAAALNDRVRLLEVGRAALVRRQQELIVMMARVAPAAARDAKDQNSSSCSALNVSGAQAPADHDLESSRTQVEVVGLKKQLLQRLSALEDAEAAAATREAKVKAQTAALEKERLKVEEARRSLLRGWRGAAAVGGYDDADDGGNLHAAQVAVALVASTPPKGKAMSRLQATETQGTGHGDDDDDEHNDGNEEKVARSFEARKEQSEAVTSAELRERLAAAAASLTTLAQENRRVTAALCELESEKEGADAARAGLAARLQAAEGRALEATAEAQAFSEELLHARTALAEAKREAQALQRETAHLQNVLSAKEQSAETAEAAAQEAKDALAALSRRYSSLESAGGVAATTIDALRRELWELRRAADAAKREKDAAQRRAVGAEAAAAAVRGKYEAMLDTEGDAAARVQSAEAQAAAATAAAADAKAAAAAAADGAAAALKDLDKERSDGRRLREALRAAQSEAEAAREKGVKASMARSALERRVAMLESLTRHSSASEEAVAAAAARADAAEAAAQEGKSRVRVLEAQVAECSGLMAACGADVDGARALGRKALVAMTAAAHALAAVEALRQGGGEYTLHAAARLEDDTEKKEVRDADAEEEEEEEGKEKGKTAAPGQHGNNDHDGHDEADNASVSSSWSNAANTSAVATADALRDSCKRALSLFQQLDARLPLLESRARHAAPALRHASKQCATQFYAMDKAMRALAAATAAAQREGRAAAALRADNDRLSASFADSRAAQDALSRELEAATAVAADKDAALKEARDALAQVTDAFNGHKAGEDARLGMWQRRLQDANAKAAALQREVLEGEAKLQRWRDAAKSAKAEAAAAAEALEAAQDEAHKARTAAATLRAELASWREANGVDTDSTADVAAGNVSDVAALQRHIVHLESSWKSTCADLEASLQEKEAALNKSREELAALRSAHEELRYRESMLVAEEKELKQRLHDTAEELSAAQRQVKASDASLRAWEQRWAKAQAAVEEAPQLRSAVSEYKRAALEAQESAAAAQEAAADWESKAAAAERARVEMAEKLERAQEAQTAAESESRKYRAQMEGIEESLEEGAQWKKRAQDARTELIEVQEALAAAEARAHTSSASVRDLAARLRSMEEEKQSLTLRLAESSTELAEARAAHSKALTQLRQLQSAAAPSDASSAAPQAVHVGVQVEQQVTVQADGEEAVQMSVRELTDIVVEQQQTIALLRKEAATAASAPSKLAQGSSGSATRRKEGDTQPSSRVFIGTDGAMHMWLPDLAGTTLSDAVMAADRSQGTDAQGSGRAVEEEAGEAQMLQTFVWNVSADSDARGRSSSGPPSDDAVWQTRVAALVQVTRGAQQKLQEQRSVIEDLRQRIASSVAVASAEEALQKAQGADRDGHHHDDASDKGPRPEWVTKYTRRLQRAAAEAEKARWREKQARAELQSALSEQKSMLAALGRAREEVDIVCSGHRADAALWDSQRKELEDRIAALREEVSDIATKADTAASRAHEAELKLVAYHAAVTSKAKGDVDSADAADARLAAMNKMASHAEAALRRLNADLGRSRSELLRLRRELAQAKASTPLGGEAAEAGTCSDVISTLTSHKDVTSPPRTPASGASGHHDHHGGTASGLRSPASPSYALVAVSVSEARRLRQRTHALESQVIGLEKARKACAEQAQLLRQRLEEREERVATLSNELSSAYLSYKSLEAEFKDKVSKLREELSHRTEEVHRLRRVLLRARSAASPASAGKPPTHPAHAAAGTETSGKGAAEAAENSSDGQRSSARRTSVARKDAKGPAAAPGTAAVQSQHVTATASTTAAVETRTTVTTTRRGAVKKTLTWK